jgi:hypothetical protein
VQSERLRRNPGEDCAPFTQTNAFVAASKDSWGLCPTRATSKSPITLSCTPSLESSGLEQDGIDNRTLVLESQKTEFPKILGHDGKVKQPSACLPETLAIGS